MPTKRSRNNPKPSKAMGQRATRSIQGTLASWEFGTPEGYEEGFAIRRYLSKFEIPSAGLDSNRKEECFDSYCSFDRSLSRLEFSRSHHPHMGGGHGRFLAGRWYRARALAFKSLKRFRLSPFSFTNGSERTPTKGLNSVQSKLDRSPWECNVQCFDLWAETVWSNHGLKQAMRRRLLCTFDSRRQAREFHSESWDLSSGHKNRAFSCFKRSLGKVTTLTDSDRFTTVPKNNQTDRPICVVGFSTMCVQRRIGEGLKHLIKKVFDKDLDSLAQEHRSLICDPSRATIDLKNASDSISLSLCEFLFPTWFYDLLISARSPYLSGLDGQYHVLNKVASMGAGFTFELMSFILMLIGTQSDETFSVFGDDIIVSNTHAHQVIRDLVSVGFIVNEDKSFVDSPFRESCGANWHDDYGYLLSFDFRYPVTIHDCVVFLNKLYMLGVHENGPKCAQFRKLWRLLIRLVPQALQGPCQVRFLDKGRSRAEDLRLGDFFWGNPSKRSFSQPRGGLLEVAKSLHLERESFRRFSGWRWVPFVASPTVTDLDSSTHWAKYLMYLYSGRKSDDVIVGRGKWVEVGWCSFGLRPFRVRDLMQHRSTSSALRR